ncbi:2Fe-2S iron-sulfur cluster-binding protein [Paenibacillus sp. GCM10012307]|uniref:2Fe-2S iron-sulfur cluster binding domain-containing protein n=1 Tax=Paenibacillus roseus TaxID=2798579 RepID=A0A934J837_9BACL|nr:2Fe-2S iron-sulfur cluster-binding protein [Paenibacillus roseus]MBJ6363514.1 2Fe-2S iron-sulfur cluster binding domain-containing protein [Paenibacillus roseus]
MKFDITFMPDDITVSVLPGTTVFDAARKAGIPIRSRCAGKAGCLMCKVTDLAGSGLSAILDNEQRKLAGMEKSGIRLSCQAKIMGAAVVEVPEDPLRAAVRRQLAKQAEEDKLW